MPDFSGFEYIEFGNGLRSSPLLFRNVWSYFGPRFSEFLLSDNRANLSRWGFEIDRVNLA